MVQYQKVSLTSEVLIFIQNYRLFEKMPYPKGNELIKNIVDKRQAQVISEQWQNKQRAFCPFYLALSPPTQIRFLHHWGIHDEQDSYYLQQYQLDPMFSSYAQNKPNTALLMHSLLSFFGKNPISADAIPGIQLESLPTANKKEATAKNWGNYLLSLREPSGVIEAILKTIQMDDEKMNW